VPLARPQAISPFIPGRYDDFMLRNLIKESAPPQSTQCEVLVDSLNRRIEGEIYQTSATVPDVPGHVERPGLNFLRSNVRLLKFTRAGAQDCGQVGARRGPNPLTCTIDMSLHGADRHDKPVGDVAVGQTGYN
jgi:hypothetical protein